MTKTTNIIIISGPTGSGESTITEELLKKHSNFARMVTATTRQKRLNEQDKVDYYFFTEVEFKKEIEKGNIPEYQNNRDKGVYYGTYKPDLDEKLSKNKIVIGNLDIVGNKYYKKYYNAITIFIAPESIDNIKTRLLHREPDMETKELEERISYAKREMEKEGPYYDYTVINKQDKLPEAIIEVENILKKEGIVDNIR